MIKDAAEFEKDHYLSGRIEKLEDKQGVVVLTDGQKVFWPLNDLPPGCQLGDKVRLVLTTDGKEAEKREQLAKTILNQILKSKEKDGNRK